jgi:SAM-dependent methyltransferase
MDTPEPDRRRELGAAFDAAAAAYRSARPGYPRELFALLATRCSIGPGSKILEIGAGTGQATIPLLDLGADVRAIEPGAALARELLDHAAGRRLRVVHGTFEDADVPVSAFDVVAAATAFHWVDPAVRVHKCARALRDGGWLAVWSHVFGDPDRPDPFHDAIQPLLATHAPELRAVDPPDRAASTDAPEPGDDEFDDSEEHVFRWEGRHDPGQLRALFSTFSSWIALPAARREPLLDAIEGIARTEFGSCVVRPYRTVVQLRRRRPR